MACTGGTWLLLARFAEHALTIGGIAALPRETPWGLWEGRDMMHHTLVEDHELPAGTDWAIVRCMSGDDYFFARRSACLGNCATCPLLAAAGVEPSPTQTAADIVRAFERAHPHAAA